MNRAVSQAIASYMDSLAMPELLLNDIANARADLHYGPLYLDDDDEECSCFDAGARRFDFSAACDRISDDLDQVSDLWVDMESGDWNTVEPEAWEDEINGEIIEPVWSDWCHVERSDVVAHIVGKSLAEYVK